jgi:hypothetical protein
VEAASPVTDVRRPRVIVVGVTPGALAVRVAPAVVIALVPATGADVGAEDLLELPQAPHTRVAVAAAAIARTRHFDMFFPFDNHPNANGASGRVVCHPVTTVSIACALLPRPTLALRADEHQASMTQPFPVV